MHDIIIYNFTVKILKLQHVSIPFGPFLGKAHQFYAKAQISYLNLDKLGFDAIR
jgi:hypothetical protein